MAPDPVHRSSVPALPGSGVTRFLKSEYPVFFGQL